MSVRRGPAIAGRIVRQLRHDPRTLSLIGIVPLVVISLVGYLISGSKQPLPVAIVNVDRGADTPAGRVVIGSELKQALGGEQAIALRDVESAGAAQDEVRSGRIAGAIVLGREMSQQMLAGQEASIRVVVVGVDSEIEGSILRAVGAAIAETMSRVQRLIPGGGRPPGLGVTIERTAVGAVEQLTRIDYVAPALIVVFAFLFTFMLTSVAFLRERSSGTLERLMVSPTSRLEVLLGYLLGFSGFALVQALLLLGYSVWVLHARVAGATWLVLLVLVVLVVGVVNLGIALSFFARNELQVVQFIPLLFLPQVFLGGLFWPVQTLHPALRWLSQLFPLTHATAALRSVMIGGSGIHDILGRLLALMAFTLAMVVLGVVALRNRRA